MGTLGGFAPPFGPPPATPTPLASLGLAKPSRDGALPAKPAGSPRDQFIQAISSDHGSSCGVGVPNESVIEQILAASQP